jgi:plastocyanin
MLASDAAGRRVSGTAPQQEGLARTGQLIAVLFFGVAAACGFFSAANASQPAPTVSVNVVDFAFKPTKIDVAPGAIVVFRNNGSTLHRIVADDGGFDSNGLQPAHAWSVTIGSHKGTIKYHDAIYPRMTGSIVVTNAAATTVAASTAKTVAATGAHTSELATTGSDATRMLAFVAVAFLTFGIAALVFARPSPVRLMVLGPLYSDDLLPMKDRARR